MVNPYKTLEDLDAAITAGPNGNPYQSVESLEDSMRSMYQEDVSRLSISAKQSLQVKPEVAIKARQLGTERGLPPDVVERNLAEVEYFKRLDDLEKTLKTAPALGQLMQDPGYLKRTHDDIERLAKVELEARGFAEASRSMRQRQDALANEQFAKTLTRLRPVQAEEVASTSVMDPRHSEQFLDNLRKGVLNVTVQGEVLATVIDRALAAAGQAFLPAPESGQPVPEVDDLTRQTQAALVQVAEAFGAAPNDKRMEVAGKIFEAAYNDGQAFKGIGDAVGYLAQNPTAILNFMGEMGAAAAPGLAIGGGATAPLRNRIMDSAMRQVFKSMAGKAVTGAGIGFFANALPTIGGEISEGLNKFDGDINQALARAGIKGVTEGAVNALFGALPLPFAGMGPGARMGNVLAETAYQATGGAAGAAAASAAVGEEISVAELFLEAIGEGFTAPIDLAASAREGYAYRAAGELFKKNVAADSALQREQRLTQFIDTIAQTDSIARDPSVVRDLLAEADETGKSEAHINARQFANIFNQSAVEVAQRFGVDAETLNDALAHNGDLVVPLADVVTVVAQDAALRPVIEHTRLDANDMAPAEARLWQSQQGAAFKAEAEVVLEKKQADEIYRAEVQQVYDTLLGQLNRASRFNEQTNKQYAAMTRDFYVTMAERAGMTVSEMAARYPLRVVAQGTGQLSQNIEQTNTPEFKNWFGDSKVVDADGKPLVVYHGTDADFTVFDLTKAGNKPGSNLGFFFSPQKKLASGYGKNTVQAYLSISKPYVMDLDSLQAIQSKKLADDERARLMSDGYDGIAVKLTGTKEPFAYIAFSPEQIKSAIGNRGTFDPANPNILMQSENTDGFERWSHGHPLIRIGGGHEFQAGEGVVVEGLHGTTGDFDTFRREFANIESDLGGGFYITNNPADVGENYAGLGPDLTNKVERLAEQIASETDREYNDPEVVAEARQRFMANEGFTMPVFVRFDNPVVLGGSTPTWISYSEKYDEETDEYAEPDGTLVPIIDALREIESEGRYGDFDAEKVIEGIFAENWDGDINDEGNITAEDLIANMKASEGLMYATDYESDNGAQAGNEIIRRVFEAAGFDGFIDQTVNKKFGSEKRVGQPMAGMDENTVHFIAFKPTQIKSRLGNSGEFSETDPNILKQGERGFFDPGSNTVGLLENADLSTFLHESGHFFLEVMADMASRPDAPAMIRADMDRLLAWFGIQGEPDVAPLEAWSRMSLEEKRQYHEQFARGFEAYLFEGKAPSVEMQGIFQRFVAWMKDVYQSLKNLNVELTDEVRGVMDRMLASDEAIKTAESVRNFATIFQTPEQAAEFGEDWQDYQDEAAQATNRAVDELQARSIRDMRWMANAKAKKIKELQATAKELRAQVMMEVRREVLSQPLYQAWQFLTGKNLYKIAKEAKADPKAVDPLTDDMLSAIAKLGGLDIEQAISEWGVDPAAKGAKADNVGGKRLVMRKGGMSLDMMGEALGSYGYVPVDANGKHDMAEFEERFFDALNGREVLSDWSEAMIPTEDPDRFINLENTPSGKLDTNMLKAVYGDSDTAIWRLLSALKMTSPEGMHPDVVANLFGFTSGDELVRRLAVAEDPKRVIEAMTDQRMLEEYADLSSPQDMERAAERAIHNDVRARVLARELAALRKANTVSTKESGNVLLKAAKQHAATWLGRQTVRNAVKHNQHVVAEGRSNRAANDAFAKGDTATAAQHKRDALLNNQLAAQSLRAADEVQKAVKYLKGFEKAGRRKAIDGAYLDQIDQLLERFDLRQVSKKQVEKRASLAKWLAAQEEMGLDPVIDARLVEDAQRQHYSTLSLDEFRAMVDAVKSIEHMGRLKTRLLTAKDKREFAKVVEDIDTSIRANANRKAKLVNAITVGEKFAKGGREYLAIHRKFSSIAREMDGGKDGGLMWEYLVRPMNEAADAEVQLRADLSERLAELTKGLRGLKLTEKIFMPEMGISLRREELIAVALNSGNEGNMQRLLDGGINAQLKGITEAQLMAALNRLSNAEWDFVEGVWALIESNRPAIAAQEKALTGVEPQWIEAVPFTLENGRTIRGGYYPAKYNGTFSSRTTELEAVTDLRQQMKGAMGNSSTRNGYTKQRAEAVKDQTLRLDIGVIAQHLNEVAHRLAWQQWLIDARRILKAKPIEAAIQEHYGPEILHELKQHIADVALGDTPATDVWGRVVQHMKAGTSIAGMGWNIMTSLLQPAGITQSIVRVGPGWVARALKKFGTHPFELTAEVHQKSVFMANRAKTFNRELNEVLNKIDNDKVSRVEESYFYLIQKFQQMVDIPTWQAAYDKALAEGSDEARAISLADSAVRESQGGGQISDLSRIQKLKQWQLFTMFFSFFNTTHQLSVEAYRGTDFKSPASVSRLAATYLLLYTLPVIWTLALREALKGDDNDEDAEKLLRKFAAEQASFLLATMIGFREIGSVVAGFNGYSGPAGTRFFNEFAKFYKQAEQGEIDKALLKSGLNSLGIMGVPVPGAGLVQFPATQISRTVEGTVAFIDGKAGPQAVLVGPPIKD